MRFLILSVSALVGVALSSCLPSHLRKYQQEPVQQSNSIQDSHSEIALVGRGGELENANTETPQPRSTPTPPPSIFVLADGTYQLALPEDQVWDSLLAVLLKNYNLTLVSREQGLVTTEWDSYSLNNTVYRNKVSARLQRVGRRGCQLTIHNNTERLSDQISQQNLWLPAEDGNDEGLRLVKNIALLLRQAPPQAQPGNIARDMSAPDLDAP